MKKLLFFILMPLFIVGCDENTTPYINQSDLPLVVEGWIEEGESPIVMVTRAIDLSQGGFSLDDYVQKWSRVSIWDDDNCYILTARKDTGYIPSLIFTNSRLKGKGGHTYRLTVETTDQKVYSVAVMPQTAPMITLKPERVEGQDSLYFIRAYVDNVERVRYLKFFIRVLGEESRFFPSFLGTVDTGEARNLEVILTKGKRAEFNSEGAEVFSHYFKTGNKVIVKCCSINEDMYNFWKIYEANVSFSENMFFSFGENLPSNIEGGLGYFTAYGLTQSAVSVP